MVEQKNRKPIANLSVAISTLNRPQALSICLDAILSGKVLPAEIIVVDQSHDGLTKNVVKQHKSGTSTLTYIYHEGRGLGAAQNLAIAHAQWPIIAITDDDCVPSSDWIERIEQAFTPPCEVDALTGRVLPLGPEAPGLYPVSLRISRDRIEFDRNALPWNIGSGNNFAVKREWLNHVGGNDERLGPGSPGQGGVDMDLFYRLLRAGARIRYEPELVVYHARTSKAGRLSRRIPYGYGMGTCCCVWLWQKDYRALPVLGSWFILRMRRLLGGVRQFQWMLAYEELLILAGTIGGFVHGLQLSKNKQRP